MKRSTLGTLSMLVFGLILLSFLVRGVGQFVLGSRGVLLVAGPISLLAALLLVAVIGAWALDRLGLVTIQDDLE